jgi:hypothetical protein
MIDREPMVRLDNKQTSGADGLRLEAADCGPQGAGNSFAIYFGAERRSRRRITLASIRPAS